jgi:hypothetical protein
VCARAPGQALDCLRHRRRCRVHAPLFLLLQPQQTNKQTNKQNTHNDDDHTQTTKKTKQELLAMQADNGPKSLGFFGTRNMGMTHQKLVEILSYAMVSTVRLVGGCRCLL